MDPIERVKFARKVRKDYSKDLWKEEICFFYLDGVSFWYKTNPLDDARSPQKKKYGGNEAKDFVRLYSKRHAYGIRGGKVVKMIVAISYSKGVISREP